MGSRCLSIQESIDSYSKSIMDQKTVRGRTKYPAAGMAALRCAVLSLILAVLAPRIAVTGLVRAGLEQNPRRAIDQAPDMNMLQHTPVPRERICGGADAQGYPAETSEFGNSGKIFIRGGRRRGAVLLVFAARYAWPIGHRDSATCSMVGTIDLPKTRWLQLCWPTCRIGRTGSRARNGTLHLRTSPWPNLERRFADNATTVPGSGNRSHRQIRNRQLLRFSGSP